MKLSASKTKYMTILWRKLPKQVEPWEERKGMNFQNLKLKEIIAEVWKKHVLLTRLPILTSHRYRRKGNILVRNILLVGMVYPLSSSFTNLDWVDCAHLGFYESMMQHELILNKLQLRLFSPELPSFSSWSNPEKRRIYREEPLQEDILHSF